MDTSKWLVDISDLKQAKPRCTSEAELRRSLAIPDPLCIFNAEGQLVSNQRKWRGIWGGVYRKTLHQLYAKEQADESELHSAGAETQQVLTVEYTASGLLDERSGFGSHCPDSARTGHLLARDITLQKQAEATSILERTAWRVKFTIHLLRRLQAFWLREPQNRYQRMI